MVETAYMVAGIVGTAISVIALLWRAGSKIAKAARTIGQIETKIAEHINGVADRFERVDERFDRLEEGVGRISRRTIEHAVRIEGLERARNDQRRDLAGADLPVSGRPAPAPSS